MESRYERQLLLEDIGEAGQARLGSAKVLVVGAGGLGCPALTYLAAAGVGHIVVVDDDLVTMSNLNRQVLYGRDDLGKKKAITAAKRLRRLNDEIEITPISKRVTEENVRDLLKEVDLVVDCVDNVATRLLLNRTCLDQGIPLVEGGVHGFYGFATVIKKGYACLECMGYEEDQEARGPVPVIGATAGVIGTIEASECIRLLLGFDATLLGKILQYDGIQHTMTKVPIKINPRCDRHPR